MQCKIPTMIYSFYYYSLNEQEQIAKSSAVRLKWNQSYVTVVISLRAKESGRLAEVKGYAVEKDAKHPVFFFFSCRVSASEHVFVSRCFRSLERHCLSISLSIFLSFSSLGKIPSLAHIHQQEGTWNINAQRNKFSSLYTVSKDRLKKCCLTIALCF